MSLFEVSVSRFVTYGQVSTRIPTHITLLRHLIELLVNIFTDRTFPRLSLMQSDKIILPYVSIKNNEALRATLSPKNVGSNVHLGRILYYLPRTPIFTWSAFLCFIIKLAHPNHYLVLRYGGNNDPNDNSQIPQKLQISRLACFWFPCGMIVT